MKRRYTGASFDTRLAVLQRAGYRCEICGGSLMGLDGMSIHHRKPRRMGGTVDIRINQTSNLMAICGSGTTGCHGWLEHNRKVAYEKGWLVRANENPYEIEVEVHQGNSISRVYLSDDAQYLEEIPNPS